MVYKRGCFEGKGLLYFLKQFGGVDLKIKPAHVILTFDLSARKFGGATNKFIRIRPHSMFEFSIRAFILDSRAPNMRTDRRTDGRHHSVIRPLEGGRHNSMYCNLHSVC